MKRRDLLATSLLGTMAGLGGFLLWSRQQLPVPEGLLWPNPPLVRAFELKSTSGGGFNAQSLQGRWTFMFFGYTYCPDVCPTTLSTMAQVAKRLRARFPDDEVQTVFVTVDPKRDTLERLKSYVQYFDGQFIGAREELDRLDDLTGQLGIAHARGEPDDNGEYFVDHSASIVLVDPEGRRVGIFSTPHDIEDIVSRFDQMRTYLTMSS